MNSITAAVLILCLELIASGLKATPVSFPESTSAQSGPAREIVFIDAGISESAVLAGAVRPGIAVVMLDPQTDELTQMADALRTEQGLAAVHLISHGAPGALQLGRQFVDCGMLAFRKSELAAIGHAIRPGGSFLLYGCNVAKGAAGQTFLRTLAGLTSVNVAASTDDTGAANLGGNWTLENRTGGGLTPPPFIKGFQYHELLPAAELLVNPGYNPIFVRPGGTSFVFTVGSSTTAGGTTYYPVSTMAYIDSPSQNAVLTRGHFQYSTDGGTTWTTYTASSSPTYISVSGKYWRFVDTTPADTNDSDSFFVGWTLQGQGSTITTTGDNIIPDNPPTDITVTGTNILDNAVIGQTMATFTPVDTGATTLGYWAIDSQSEANLFVLTNNTAVGNTAALTLGTGALPADFQTASVTVHYYDMYQTDSNAKPISGQGISKTFTFRVVPEATTNLNFTSDELVNTFTNNDQSYPAIASLSDGTFVTAWQSAGEGGKTSTNYYGIYGQHFTSTGSKIGGEFAISSTAGSVNETLPNITPLAGGRYAVAYSTLALNTNACVGIRIVETNGTVDSQIIANTVRTNNAYNPVIATLADGSFVVAWYDDASNIKLQQFAASNGATIGTNLFIAKGTGFYPSIAALSNGSYAVAWVDASSYDVMVQIGATGTPFDTGIGWGGQLDGLHAAGLASGFVVISDVYNNNSSLYQVVGALYNNSGVQQGTNFNVNANVLGNRFNSTVAAMSDGGFIAAWESDYDDFDPDGIFGRRFTATGVPEDTAEFEINQHRANDQTQAAVTGLPGGLFASAWTTIPDSSIAAQSYLGDIYARVMLPVSVGTGIQAINRVDASPTNLSSVQWTVTLGASVTGLNATNFQLVAAGLTGSPAITSVTGSGTNWTVTASTGAGGGTLQLNLTNAAGISPSITNSLPYAGQSYSIDLVPPTIAIGAPSVAITNNGSVSYTVTYGDANFNASTLAAGNITVNATGTAAASSVVVTGSGTTRTVTLSGITGNGTLGISIAAGTASDLAGNLAPAAGPSATFVVDTTPPTITISAPSVSITNSGEVIFTVTYSDTNFNTSTLNAGSITVTKTGTALPQVTEVPPVLPPDNGAVRHVILTDLIGDGTLSISIAAGTASDLAGNLAPAAGPSAAVIVDNTAPTVTIGQPSLSLVTTNAVSYPVTYYDAHFNASTLASNNITVNATGSAAASIVTVTGSGTNYTVTLSGISGQGTLGISLAAGTASDLAGNLAAAAGPSTAFTVDLVPLITVQPTPQSAPALGSATFNVTASGTSPLFYQWSKDGTPLGNATGASLTLTNLNRASVGYYSVTVSNAVGLVASTNVLLRVLIPQKFGQVLQPANSFSPTFQALFRDTNGTVATLWYATNFFQMLGSTNLPTDWEPISGTMSLTNGWILFQNNDPTNPPYHPYRFYRVEEQ